MTQMKRSAIVAAAAAALVLTSIAHANAFLRPAMVGSVPSGAPKWFTVNLTRTTTAAQAEGVANYYRQFGLSVKVDAADELLFAHGTYGQAAAAAHSWFAQFKNPDDRFVSLARPESYPASIAAHILATTISDGPRMYSNAMLGITSDAAVAPSLGYTPADIATYYDIKPIYALGVKGANTNVAIVACASVVPGDITKFESEYSLPSAVPTIVNVDGGTPATALEPTGDVERVIGTAPSTKVTLYVAPGTCSAGNLADAMAQVLADETTKHYAALSHSYGATEDLYDFDGDDSLLTAEDTDLAGISAKNTGIFIASGDVGAYSPTSELLFNGEVTVQFPPSDPNIVSVGGTDALSVSATNTTRLQELAWGVSGGGVSHEFAIPSWQKTIPGIASTTNRNMPDVALDSSCGTTYAAVWTPNGGTQGNYLFCGTSFAAPTWAGLWTLIDSGRAAAAKKKLANAPMTIYAHHGVAGLFFDLKAGNNGFYNVQPGYDNVTGFGVPDADVLYKTLVALP